MRNIDALNADKWVMTPIIGSIQDQSISIAGILTMAFSSAGYAIRKRNEIERGCSRLLKRTLLLNGRGLKSFRL